jgi:NADPH:quinone reductase-like Zn-dependent oxidoreductase
MRAIVTSDFGSPAELSEVEAPSPGPGEIRIKVRASSLNGFDNSMVRGYLGQFMEHQFPATLGRDFAGTVDEVGSGVSAFEPGDDVFGVVLTQPLHAGGFAEYLVIPEDHNVAPIPAGLDHATAGALGLAGSAAIACLDAVQPGPGELILVSGATGGVGALVSQFAAARGATVIATARPGAEEEFVRQQGATHVVDYAGDVAAQLRAVAPDGVDAVVHLAGDPVELASLIKVGGRFTTLLSADPGQADERGITVTPTYATPFRATLERLASDVVAGRIRVPVQRTYALAEIPQAFLDFSAGTIGKLAVVID